MCSIAVRTPSTNPRLRNSPTRSKEAAHRFACRRCQKLKNPKVIIPTATNTGTIESENGGITKPAMENMRFGSHQPNSPAKLMPTKIEPSPKNESKPPTQSISCVQRIVRFGSDRLNSNTRSRILSEGANAQRQPKVEAR